MAWTLIEQDTVEGASYSDDAQQRQSVRRFIVQDDDPTGALERTNRLLTAIQIPGIPTIGQAHPNDGSQKCAGRQINPIAGDAHTMEVVCSYRQYTAADALVGQTAEIEWTAGLQSVETNYDEAKQLMQVTNPVTGEVQALTVSIQVPTQIVRARRKMSEAPLADFDKVGMINSNLFFIGSYAISQKVARCNNIIRNAAP